MNGGATFSQKSNPKYFAILTIFTLYFALIAVLLVPGNPDYLLPIFPEAMLLTGLGLAYLLAFKWLKMPNSIWFTTKELKAFAILFCCIFLYCLPRMIWGLEHTPHQIWNPCANIAPSAFVRLECYLQGAITQFPGPRQFYMLVTAFLVGVLAFLFSRTLERGQRLLANTIVVFSCIYCATVFIGLFSGLDYLLPNFLGRAEYGGNRFALIHPNPSWIWPYLMPGMACSLWGIARNKTLRTKLFFFAASLLLTLSIYKTGQRGGLLLAATLWGTFTMLQVAKLNFTNKMQKKVTLIVLISLLTIAGLFGKDILDKLLAGLGRSHFFDTSRTSIWKTALNHVLTQEPLLGFGYASWFQEYRSVATPAGAPIFDTAHNLFVQTLFEHGIVGGTLIVSALVSVAWIAWQTTSIRDSRRTLILLACAGFFCCALVQEIDYIRPTFYIHALLWGTLAGGRSEIPSDGIQPTATRSNPYVIFAAKHFVETRIRTLKTIVLIGMTLTSAIGYMAFNYFSLGAYPFEGDLAKKEERVGRWLGPRVRLSSFGQTNYWTISIAAAQDGSAKINEEKTSECLIRFESGKLTSLQLRTESKYFPTQTQIAFSDASADGPRFISARIFYPPELKIPNHAVPNEKWCAPKN
jgi:O-antigen ligase